MKKLFASGGMNQQMGDPMEQMMVMMVEQAKIQDEMFERHGVEEDEFNEAVMHHRLFEDPEIMRR